MGAVAVTEQAIINEAHQRGMVVPNRKGKEEHGETQAAGAYVAHPKKGCTTGSEQSTSTHSTPVLLGPSTWRKKASSDNSVQ
jgi:hypothetical protein